MAVAADAFDVLAVLTRAGADRDGFCALVGDAPDIDAQLVSDVLRQSGRVGDTLETRRTLVELCGLLRAIDATELGRITLDELRSGLAMHAARTDRFAAFHDARVLLRTLEEVLETAGEQPLPAVLAQVAYLHRELRTWLLEQLTGSAEGELAAPPAAPDADAKRAPYAISDPVARAAADALAVEVQEGANHHPVTGLLGAAWMRDWGAVPLAGDLLGDDLRELDRLAEALGLLDPIPTELVQVERRPSPRWRLDGARVHIGDQLRDSWSMPASRDGLDIAVGSDPRRAATIITTPELSFAYVEDDGWHALLGPRDMLERACGRPHLEAIAAFRLHVEELAVDDEPPPDLLAVAMSFGRLRRRAR